MSWGNKITLSIYVEGGDDDLALAAQSAARYAALHLDDKGWGYTIDFVGASVEPVQDKPKDQG